MVMRATFFFTALLLLCSFCALSTSPAFGGVVIMYHRFDEARYTSTSVTRDQLVDQLNFLRQNGFRIVPLRAMLDAVEGGADTRNWVAISVDDGFRSFIDSGWALFEQFSVPVTIFVSTGIVGTPGFMGWEELQQLHEAGVDIQPHGVQHRHFPTLSYEQQFEVMRDSIETLKARLGIETYSYAYPYGEADASSAKALRALGIDYGFGQHSGALSENMDRFYMPRFPINERYGAMDRFRLITRVAPLDFDHFEPSQFALTDPPHPMSLRFSGTGLEGMACYDSVTGRGMARRVEPSPTLGPTLSPTLGPTLGRADAQSQASSLYVFEAHAPWPRGRVRVNCTLKDEAGWRWFGWQYLVR